MARESFQDAATAAELDAGFVASRSTARSIPKSTPRTWQPPPHSPASSAWPLTVFATPEGRPFFAGTYFPPEPRAACRRSGRSWPRCARPGQSGATRSTAPPRPSCPPWRTRGRADGEGAPTPTVEDLAAAAQPSPIAKIASTAGSAAPTRPPRSSLSPPPCDSCRPAVRARRAPEASGGRRPRARGHGGLRAARPGRGRLLPLRDPARLVRAALRAHAHRQRTAARRRPRRRTRGRCAGRRAFLLGRAAAIEWSASASRGSGSEPRRGRIRRGAGLRVRGSTGPAARAGTTRGMPRHGHRSTRPPSTARSSRAGTASRSALSHAPGAAGRTGADRCRALCRGRRARRQPHSDGASSAPRSTASRPVRAATLADYGQLAAGPDGSGDGAPASRGYAVEPANSSTPASTRSGRSRVPGGGDPVLAEQGVAAPDAASDGDEPSGVRGARRCAAPALWLLGAGEEYRALAERVVAAHATRGAGPAPRARRAAARRRGCSRYRRGRSWSSPPTPMTRSLRPRAASRPMSSPS